MKKKTIIISAIVIVLLAGIFFVRPALAGAGRNEAPQTVTLARNDLVDSVLVSGTVESSNSKKVYSRLSAYTVEKVLVKTGDRVKAGDLLAQLDTTTLESDIRQAELNVKNSQSALDNESAANRSALQNAENSARLASVELDTAKSAYERSKALASTGAISPDELDQAETALQRAQISYDNAQVTLKSSQRKNLTQAGNNLEIQKLSLAKLKQNLSDAKITAPIDGTVTMVNAAEGEAGSGLLFVVEDTDRLIVRTSIGEYDIGLIGIGQEVAIKSDSTGDKEFAGTVSRIAPTALRDAGGDIAASSNVQFDTEVSLKDRAPEIKIGMNVRLTIKLNEKKNVFTVPYDAIIAHDDGSKWVKAMEDAGNKGRTKDAYKEIPVNTGMETDMYVEISGEDLKEGLKVLANPQEAGKAAE